MTRIFYSKWVKPACCVSKISSDGGCQSKETGVGMEVRLLSVGARGFFLAASPLNSVAPNEKKTSGTQGTPHNAIFRFFYMGYWPILRSRWLDIGRALFLRVFGPRRSQRTRPISSHLHRTNLVNEGFIIWLSGKFFLVGRGERAR